MKSRTSLFNKTVLLKDITRFCPIWIIFTIINLMPTLGNVSNAVLMEENYTAYLLGNSTGSNTLITLGYAMICALFLFGDLFKSKLCNALHALPLRRECWFATHFLAGVLFFLVPSTVNALICLPYMGEYWFVAPMWLLAVTLMYLFFFSLAVFCIMFTGSRFAACTVYALINFFSMLCYWMVETYYAPLLPGLHIRDDIFKWFCPLEMLMSGKFFLFGEVAVSPSAESLSSYDIMTHGWKYVFQGFGESWLYIGILAALSVAFFVLALVLYRKRNLESAGDFLAFRKPQPVFLVIFSLTIGAIFQSIFGLFDSNIVSMIIGLVIGCYAGQMLLRRTVKVFDKRSLIWAGALAAALGLTLVVTGIDPLGLTRWTPKPEQIESITLSDDYEYIEDDDYYGYSNTVTITNPQQIEKLVSVHQQILSSGSIVKQEQLMLGITGEVYSVHLTYHMADGRDVVRRYYFSDSTIYKDLAAFYSTPQFILGYADFDTFFSHVNAVYLDGEQIGSETTAKALLEAVWADCEAGNMAQDNKYLHSANYWIEIETDSRYFQLTVQEDSENTLAWIKNLQNSH